MYFVLQPVNNIKHAWYNPDTKTQLLIDTIWLERKIKLLEFLSFDSFQQCITFSFFCHTFLSSLIVSNLVCVHAHCLTLSLHWLVVTCHHVVAFLFCTWRWVLMVFDTSELGHDVFILILLRFWPETPDNAPSVNYYYRTNQHDEQQFRDILFFLPSLNNHGFHFHFQQQAKHLIGNIETMSSQYTLLYI